MSKWNLQWSPFEEDSFISFTADKLDLNLYQWIPIKQDETDIKNPQHLASKTDLFIRNKDDLQLLKCFAYCPVPASENVLAVGLSNGKVVITGYNTDPSSDKSGLVGVELPPRSVRPCTALAWSPVDRHYLAVVHDKHKPSANTPLTVWDPFISSTPARPFPSLRGIVAEYPNAQGDNVHSVAWLHHNFKYCLACGLGGKYLKLHDIRSPAETKISTNTKAVYGITPNQHQEYQLASFYDDQIYIWDLRHFDKAVLSMKEPQPILKMQWSTTRKNMLVSLTKDSSAIKLFNVEHVGSNEVEYTERLIQPFGNKAVSMFTMHPTQENTMLVVSPLGVMQKVLIHDVISFSLSPDTTCSMASGRNLLVWSGAETILPDDDISCIMRQRAMDGYGLLEPLCKNAKLLREEDSELAYIWEWLHRMKTSQTDGNIPQRKSQISFYGIKSVIKGSILEESKTPTDDLESPLYRTRERTLALKLCGWPVDGEDSTLREFIQRLEKSDCYERAAAVAVFLSKTRMAIDILNRGSETPRGRKANFNAVALALAGMSTSKKSLWNEMCNSLYKQMDDPYLRAFFGFLTANENAKYDAVLKEEGMVLKDRIAFACLYASDTRLHNYIEEMIADAIREGDLRGVLLTGVNKDGIELLQAYLDKTSDIQSVSCIMMHAKPIEHTQEQSKRVSMWIDHYRGLLDRWRLWHQRAKFDMEHHSKKSSPQVMAQIVVNCHYCQNPISPSELGMKSYHSSSRRNPVRTGNTFKTKNCYICKKSLPRCALCLLNMGTSSLNWKLLPQSRRPNLHSRTQGGGDNPAASKLTDFADWFTWCQSCRHGGHASHLMEWFKEHSECPVSACHCACMSLDSVGVMPAADTMKPS